MRDKGKIKLSKYFQNLKTGDKVAIVREHSLNAEFPRVLQGRTGIVEGHRGRCAIVLFKIGAGKRMIVHPVHLKKLKA